MVLITNEGQELTRKDIENAVDGILLILEGYPQYNCIGILDEAKSILSFRCYYHHQKEKISIPKNSY